MSTKKLPAKIVGFSAPAEIQAGEQGEDGKKMPAKFSATFYTGGAMRLNGWDLPVAVDLAGLERGNVLVANLDHDSSKRVGNFDVMNDGTKLVATGTATAATAARDEVVNSAMDGYQWQTSLEVNPREVEMLKAGKKAEVNGQTIEGPAYIVRAGTLKGFGFVSHGADDNTNASIAASAASSKGETSMDAKFRTWVEAMGFDADNLTDQQVEGLKANFDGKNAKPKEIKASDPFQERKLEAKRRQEMREIADRFIELRGSDYDEIEAIEKMYDHAVEAGMTAKDFRLEMYESSAPGSFVPRHTQRTVTNNRVLEAAICQAGRLGGHEDKFDDQTLQAAHDQFKGRIGLQQLFLLAAEANGYRSSYSRDINLEVQRFAFGLPGYGPGRHVQASGFSGLDISTILSNTANKFLMEGWNAVDQTPLRIAAIQSVRDFKTITTVSLTDSVIFDKVGNDGEIKHGTLSEITYTNKADTYARMLAITRQDIINDDLGALTSVPRKLGAGAMKKLNDIFWAEYLGAVAANFFAAGNSNINTGVANMTTGGLSATEVIFMNQTNPDGTPLGIMPEILLVPTALKSAAYTLMNSEKLIDGTATATQGDANVFRGRFRVESSPYISNSAYTGNTSVGWWLLADPSVLPVIAIAALNGRVEPVVETAEAEFSVLGVQMRGYSDVGVNLQEYRGGVYADGGAS